MNVSTVAGSGAKGSDDGQGTAATLIYPNGVAHDRHGNTFISEDGSHRIRKMAPGGAVTTYAGSTKGHQDGPGDHAQFNEPCGMACDAAGNLFVADCGNHRIRMITPARVVTTVAGTGEAGCDDRPAAHATFTQPTDVAVHPLTGNLAVADLDNHRIRLIVLAKDGAGNGVFTLAGSTEGFQDGPSNTAKFKGPASVDYDAEGSLYVADYSDHRVRKISPAHIVSTLAGAGTAGMQDGAGDQATFRDPWGIAVDGNGAVVVADSGNHRVRLISQDGATSTLAGSTRGFQDGQGTAAKFMFPYALAIDSTGGALVADNSNHRLRRIATNLAPKAWPALEDTTPPPIPTFNTDMGKLLDPAGGDELFHDVSFQIEGDIIHANKCILSSRCEYFSTMLTSDFTEGASGSGMEAPLMVADTTPAAFRALLTYLYTDTIELDDTCVVDVACLSQRYLVTPLQEACVEYCKEHVSLANAVQWLVAAHTHMLEELRGALLEYTSTHYLEIEETAPATLDLLDDHRRLFREGHAQRRSSVTACHQTAQRRQLASAVGISVKDVHAALLSVLINGLHIVIPTVRRPQRRDVTACRQTASQPHNLWHRARRHLLVCVLNFVNVLVE